MESPKAKRIIDGLARMNPRRRRGRARKTDPARAVAYIRVSTDRQELGPEAQRESIERWAAEHEVEVQAWLQEEESGSLDGAGARDKLWDAIQLAGESRVGRMLIAKSDRLSRDPVFSEIVRMQLAGDRIELVVTGEQAVNGTDATSELIRSILDAVAKYERDLIRARTRAALRAKFKRGEQVSFHAPYGWSHEQGKLQEVEHEQTVIGAILDMRQAGLTVRDIVEVLDRDRVPARGNKWHPTTVQRILARARQAKNELDRAEETHR